MEKELYMREINGLVFTKDLGYRPGKIIINKNHIIEKIEFYDDEMKEIVPKQKIIPGLIDIHMHGAAGYDFCDASIEALENIDKYEKEHGIVKFCCATMTLPEEKLTEICKISKEYRKKCDTNHRNSGFEGIYLEGPFISNKKCGAQNANNVMNPDFEMLCRLNLASGNIIKYVVTAPEINGSKQFIKEASITGISISIGHTEASYEQAICSIENGARHITHLYNAMSEFNHRNPGVVGAALVMDDVETELIADGVHVDEAAIKLAFKVKEAEKIILISDSTMATGIEDGEYHLGDKKIIKKGNRAVLENGVLAGSVSNLYECMKYAITLGVSEQTAINAATMNPAKSLGIDNMYGSIEEGKSGEIIITDMELNIIEVITNSIK